jgi:glutathione S-transferase
MREDFWAPGASARHKLAIRRASGTIPLRSATTTTVKDIDMKLYYAKGACSLSPHIVLLEAGLPYTLEKVDMGSKKTDQGVDYLTVNSKGAVPALQLDDGKVLTEGPAVVQYLADLKPESGLAPRAGSFERYQLMEILNYITSEVHKGFSPLFNPASSADMKTSAKATSTRNSNGSRPSSAARPT